MGTLLLVGTPIGNLEDLSPRAAASLSAADALACEDTRVTRRIFEKLGLHSPGLVFACHDQNEARAVQRILGCLEAGQTVALCSDGGMPLVSDPGYRVVQACLEAGHDVRAVPGPSAVTTAIALSGLPTASFTYKGFPPRKPGPRKRFFEAELASPHTLVCFESPFRLAPCLRDAHAALGYRAAAVCLEMTKRFERVERGSLAELADRFAEPPKGEATLVIAGAPSRRQQRAEQAEGDEGGDDWMG